jgi:hypothetical protein
VLFGNMLVGAVVTARRRARLRAAAAALHAHYDDPGPFSLGAIKGHNFTVRFAEVEESFFTTVEVPTAHGPGDYILQPDFFAAPPNWSYAKASGTESWRAVGVQIASLGYPPPNDEQRAALERWLERTPASAGVRGHALNAVKITSVTLSATTVSTRFQGIVRNPDELRRVIDLLGQLAS